MSDPFRYMLFGYLAGAKVTDRALFCGLTDVVRRPSLPGVGMSSKRISSEGDLEETTLH